MKIDKWKCDKCGVEFEGNAYHHEEFDLCEACHTVMDDKRKLYLDEIDLMQEAKLAALEIGGK